MVAFSKVKFCAAPLGWLALATFVVGCGSDGGKLALRGSVAVDGVEAGDGVINFMPTSGTSSPVAAGPVKNGRFSIASRNGVMPGTFKVTFRLPVERTKPVATKPADMSNFDLGKAVKDAMANAPDVPDSYSIEIKIDKNTGSMNLDFSKAAAR